MTGGFVNPISAKAIYFFKQKLRVFYSKNTNVLFLSLKKEKSIIFHLRVSVLKREYLYSAFKTRSLEKPLQLKDKLAGVAEALLIVEIKRNSKN